MINECFYGNLLKVEDLLKDIDIIYDNTVKMFKMYDRVNDNDLKTQLQLLFNPLIEEQGWRKLFTRYSKLNEGNRNITLARLMYNAFYPLYTSKQWFNAGTDWKSIQELFIRNKEINLKEMLNSKKTAENISEQASFTTSTGKTQDDKQMNVQNNESGNTQNKTGNYINGQQIGEDLLPKYLNDGSKNDTTNKAESSGIETHKNTLVGSGQGTQTGNTTDNLKSNEDNTRDFTKTVKENRPMWEAMSEIQTLIDNQKFAMNDAFYSFTNAILLPNQNINFELFPWPWTFGGIYQ